MDQNNHSNGSALRTAAATIGILCCLAGGSPVFADTPSHPYGAVSSNLTFTDLDLAKPADVAVARERIHQVARTLCTRVLDMNSLSHQPDYVACIADAMAKADPRLQQLAAQKSRETHFVGLQR